MIKKKRWVRERTGRKKRRGEGDVNKNIYNIVKILAVQVLHQGTGIDLNNSFRSSSSSGRGNKYSGINNSLLHDYIFVVFLILVMVFNTCTVRVV